MMGSLRFEVEDLVIERGGRRILDRVSFSAGPGDYVEVTGPNGAGKTSLLRTLAGLLRPADGRVFAASNLGPLDDDEKMRALHFVGHRDGLKGPLSVQDHAEFWRRLYGGEEEMKVIEAIGLGPLKHRAARTLSAGQARRLSLSRLLIAPRSIWLLDEPASNLDVQGRAWLLGLVGDHLAAGGILIAAVHDPIGYGPTREIAIDGLGAEPEFLHEPEDAEPEAEADAEPAP
jgi:heme exporter protein A